MFGVRGCTATVVLHLMITSITTKYYMDMSCAEGFLPTSSCHVFGSKIGYFYKFPLALTEDGSLSEQLLSSFSCSVQVEMDSTEASRVIDEVLLPVSEYSERSNMARDAQGVDAGDVLDANDARLSLTYDEFPLHSFEALVELGLEHFDGSEGNFDKNNCIHLVDLGSGCGRLVLFAGLTMRRRHNYSWNIHGIEITNSLHRVAVNAAIRGREVKGGENIFTSEIEPKNTNTQIHFHSGPVKDYRSILKKASIVFAYSTVFPAEEYSEELESLLLASEWSTLLSESCSHGCIVITTDRALRSSDGFELVDRLDVDNPSLWGSTGFVHILKKQK